MLRLLVEPAQLLGPVGGVLGGDQGRPQPVDLLLAAVVAGHVAIFGPPGHGGLLDDAHDGLLRGVVGDAVGAAVADDQKGLVAGVFGVVSFVVHVGDQFDRSGVADRCCRHL